MANVTVGDLVNCGYALTAFGQRYLFSLMYRVDAITAGPIDVTEFSLSFAASLKLGGDSAIYEEYQNVITSSATIQYAFAQIVKPNRYRQQRSVINLAGAGSVANTGNVCAVMTRITERSGRDQLSNNHPGPIPNDASTAGSLGSTFKAEVEDLAAICATPITLSGVGVVVLPIIWHRNVPGPTLSFDDIVDGFAQSTTRVMTRRTVGRGE